MKKILFTIALVMTMAFCANAQRDGFFGDWQYEERTMSDVENGLALPNTAIGSHLNSSAAPLGSGLLILTALGAGYVLTKKKRR